MIVQQAAVQTAIHRWLERLVVGLNLCPFAAAPLRKNAVRVAVSDALTEEGILTDLLDEAFRLTVVDAEVVSTTLLVIPQALEDFSVFNEFLHAAEGALQSLGLEGELQLASFHPDYQFADSAPDDVGNYSNRAPFPVLHLLREAELSRVLAHHPDPARIYRDNIQRLEGLGVAQLREMLVACGAGLGIGGSVPENENDAQNEQTEESGE